MVGEAPLSTARTCLRRLASALGGIRACGAAAQGLVVEGACRDGEPNGAYTLRAADGRLRVAGAFAKGRRTGTFLFWSERGARIAVIPYDNDRKAGTIALWYAPPAPGGGRAAQVGGGVRRRSAARRKAVLVSERQAADRPSLRARRARRRRAPGRRPAHRFRRRGARSWRARDVVTDEQFYATLEALVADHRPKCE